MAKKISISISSHPPSVRLPRKKITELVTFIARTERAAFVEVDIAIVGSRKSASMNRKYLKHTGATDIITFDQSELALPGLRCQLVVCGDIARKEALQRGGGVQRELLLYIIHGLLHMIGYDDTTPQEAEKMYAQQEKLLAEFFKSCS